MRHFLVPSKHYDIMMTQHLVESSNTVPSQGVINYSVRQPLGVAGSCSSLSLFQEQSYFMTHFVKNIGTCEKGHIFGFQ